MKKILFTLSTLLPAVAFLVLPAPHADAQLVFAGEKLLPVPQYTSADDSDVAMLVKYVGSNTSATVAVDAATGDLTFQVGGAAYTGFECPVAGALGGIIDVSNASCDTMQEVVDTINGKCTGCSSDFRAVLVDSLGSDTSIDALVTIGATQVTRADGLSLNIDTSVALVESKALIPTNCRSDIRCYMDPSGRIKENPFAGQQTVLNWLEGYSTYGAGSSAFNVYSVKPSYKGSAGSTETVTTLWNEAAGATTVNAQLTQFQYFGVFGKPDEKVIARLTNTDAMATVRLLAYGTQKSR